MLVLPRPRLQVLRSQAQNHLLSVPALQSSPTPSALWKRVQQTRMLQLIAWSELSTQRVSESRRGAAAGHVKGGVTTVYTFIYKEYKIILDLSKVAASVENLYTRIQKIKIKFAHSLLLSRQCPRLCRS